jgi:hypothetical protein
MWSGWKWLCTTSVTCSGVTPAARMLAIAQPPVGASCPPVPASNRMVSRPVCSIVTE